MRRGKKVSTSPSSSLSSPVSVGETNKEEKDRVEELEDGSAKEHRYFQCAPKTGVFVRPEKVDVVAPWSDDEVHARTLDYCVEHNLLSDEDLREIIRRTRAEMAADHTQ